MRKLGLILLCAGIAAVISGCASSEGAAVCKPSTESKDVVESKLPDETNNAEESKETEPEVEKELTTADLLEGTDWDFVLEKKFDYKCYDGMFYSDDCGVSVGYSGEIHYYKPDDQSWEKAENSSMCRFGIEIIDGTVCYTCGNGGDVTKSVDGGKTFTKMTDYGDSEPNQCTLISFCDANTGIAAGKVNFGITYDGAQTWNDLTYPEAEIISIKMESKDQFCYIDNAFNMSETTDGGATFSTTPLNLPEGADYTPLKKTFEIVKTDDNTFTIYCVQKSTGMLKSYTTHDHFATYEENTMPELKIRASYLHVKGEFLSIFDKGSATLKVIKQK